MTGGAIVENPSPVTPARVYLEQGWIIAAGGGRCAPTSPCAGDGGRTPPPLLPQPGEIATATLGCGGTAHAGGGKTGTAEMGGKRGQQAAGLRHSSKMAHAYSSLCFQWGGVRASIPRDRPPKSVHALLGTGEIWLWVLL